MPTIIRVDANEKAVLISNEQPDRFLDSGRHFILWDLWKRTEFFPKAEQLINIGNITVQLPQAIRKHIFAETQIEVSFYYEFANGNDLLTTVKYTPSGAGSISERISNLIKAEITAKVANFASHRSWDEALWTREAFQKDLNENIKTDSFLVLNKLKLQNCRVVITKLNLPDPIRKIMDYNVEAEGDRIHVQTITSIMEDFEGKFGLSESTKNLIFFLSVSSKDAGRILQNMQMNSFMIAPAIKDLLGSLAGGTSAQQEGSLNRLMMKAENHQEEVSKILKLPEVRKLME